MPPLPDKLINQLPLAATPLAGTEIAVLMQGGQTVQTPVSSIVGGSPGIATQYRMGDGSLKYANGPVVNVKDFGATGDGSTDDTAALNACFASVALGTATVIMPTGFYKTTGTIVVGHNGSGGQSHINIVSLGSGATTGISYNGPTNGIALQVCKNTNFWFTDFAVNNGVARGTTTGIQFGSNGVDSGNQTSNFYCKGLVINGFHVGVQAGGNGGDASEGTFQQCSIASCDTGFTATGFNCLDYNFLMLSMGFNTVGIDSGAGDGINVFGGSASFNNVDFTPGNNASIFNVCDFRSEVATTAIMQGSGNCKATLRNCSAASPAGTTSVTGSYTNLIIEDCTLQGSVSPTTLPDVLVMQHNVLSIWDTTHNLPVIIPTAGGQTMVSRAVLRDNSDVSTFPGTPIQEFDGTLGVRFDGGVNNNPFAEAVTTIVPIDHRNTISAANPYGIGYIALTHVKQLSEGTMPGVAAVTPGVATPGQNLRVSGTFVSSNSLTVNFVRTGLTVSASGSVITASVGNFLATDVGKAIKITAGADTGADWYGYITKFTSSTVVEVYPNAFVTPGARNSNASAKAAQVGANEPDGAYLVAGLCGNANETFWVTGITNTGFTLHSSNTTSTANVTALIVR